MIKSTLLILCGIVYAFGMDYQTFKAQTLKHAKTLKSQGLTLQIAQEERDITLRSENPTLSLELSNYDAKAVSSRMGYATSISQKVRTDSYLNALKTKADATTHLTEALVTHSRAAFLKNLEMRYTAYVFESKMLTLLQEELTLSRKVAQMVKARYQGGSEKRVAYLQAKTDLLRLKTQLYATRQQRTRYYHQLLAAAGFTQKVTLAKRFIYPVSGTPKATHKPNPQARILEAKKRLYKSDYRINQSRFREYELFAGIEREPDQSIIRAGVNIPLPLFNDRSEERMLAKLKMAQTALDQEQLAIDTRAETRMLRSSIKTLGEQYHTIKALQQQQQELVALLQEGYRIAQGSLFELMQEKSRLIQTRKALLETKKRINEETITLHFLQGDYNE